jgi:hypothetical protein
LNHCHHAPARAHCGAHPREQSALQIIAVADQIVGVLLKGKFAGFEIGDAGIHNYARRGSALAQNPDAHSRGVYSGHAPTSLSEVQRVPPGATSQIERVAGRDAGDGGR